MAVVYHSINNGTGQLLIIEYGFTYQKASWDTCQRHSQHLWN